MVRVGVGCRVGCRVGVGVWVVFRVKSTVRV